METKKSMNSGFVQETTGDHNRNSMNSQGGLDDGLTKEEDANQTLEEEDADVHNELLGENDELEDDDSIDSLNDAGEVEEDSEDEITDDDEITEGEEEGSEDRQ